MKEVPFYMVFVLYLIISSNFLAPLFSCRFQYFLQNNMIAKHFAGYMTLLFFVVLSSGEKDPPSTLLLQSLIVYIVFWISTRMSFYCLLLFLFLSASLYIIHLYEQKNGSTTKNNHQFTRVKQILQYVLCGILVAGFVLYLVEKKIEYKKNFSIRTFVFDKNNCRKKSPTLTTKRLVKYLRS